MIIDIDYKQVKVPQDIIEFCDYFTVDAEREDIKYLDFVYMNLGYYGNDPDRLKIMRNEINPVFE